MAAALTEHAEALVNQLVDDALHAGNASDRTKASETLFARVLGKPKETLETVAKRPGSMQELDAMSPEQRQALLLELEGAVQQH